MKIIKNLFGIIAVSAIIVSFAACAEDDEDPPPPANVVPSGHLGGTLTFTEEKVYTRDGSEYTLFEGTKTFSPIAGGTPTLAAGKFSYTAGTPPDLDDGGADLSFDEYWENITASSESVRTYVLTFEASDGSHLEKGETSFTSTTYTSTYLVYIYVDGDLTVTGDGKTRTESGMTTTVNALNLSLKTGWNAFCLKQSATQGEGGNANMTITASIAHPALKWVLQE